MRPYRWWYSQPQGSSSNWRSSPVPPMTLMPSGTTSFPTPSPGITAMRLVTTTIVGARLASPSASLARLRLPEARAPGRSQAHAGQGEQAAEAEQLAQHDGADHGCNGRLEAHQHAEGASGHPLE